MMIFSSGLYVHKNMKSKILNYLKEKNDFVSGQDISRDLQVSRTAVWKYVKQLQAIGYDIEAVSRKGYRLIAQPDKLFPDLIQDRLGTKVFGKKIIYLESTNSTMNDAARLAIEGAREGTIVCAETQTDGRGRRGRNWISAKGQGVYFSIVLRPHIPLSQAAALTLVFAVALSKAIRVTTGLEAVIKWPNDILISKKKVAGILMELSAETDHIHYIVVGIGLNVEGKAFFGLPQATSLEQQLGQGISRVQVFQEILRQAEEHYTLFQKKGFAPIAKIWREYSATLHQQVKITEARSTTEGIAIDIDDQGALLIQERSGRVVRKISGDVIHLR